MSSATQLIFGDPAEGRTPDTLIKSQVLYLLSYWVMAGVAGFEPTNDGVKVRCLTAWLYPIFCLYDYGEPTGIRTPDTRLRRPLLYPTEL